MINDHMRGNLLRAVFTVAVASFCAGLLVGAAVAS